MTLSGIIPDMSFVFGPGTETGRVIYDASARFGVEAATVSSSKIEVSLLNEALPEQDFVISNQARARMESWGASPDSLDLIAQMGSVYSYTRPDLHAQELFSQKTVVEMNGEEGNFTLPLGKQYDSHLPFGDCAELAHRLKYVMVKNDDLMREVYNHAGLIPGIAAGKPRAFFTTGDARHIWLTLVPFEDALSRDFRSAINIDPSFRRIETLEESGYTLGRNKDGSQWLSFSHDQENDVESRTFLVGKMFDMGVTFRVAMPDRYDHMPGFILGATHDSKYVLDMGLCVSGPGKLDWVVNLLAESSRPLTQIVLQRHPSSKKNKPLGLRLNRLSAGFDPLSLDKITIAQIYASLLAATSSLHS